jgi:hypothetical protein
VVIRPLEPHVMNTNTIEPHAIDKGLGSIPATCFLVFDSPIGEPVETIRGL